jgi:hypothetical protein
MDGSGGLTWTPVPPSFSLYCSLETELLCGIGRFQGLIYSMRRSIFKKKLKRKISITK